MINLYYQPFFTLAFLHDYFASKQCADVEVIPAADCQKLFNGLNIQWRIKENEFRTWIKVNDIGGPFINNPANPAPDDKVYRESYGKDIFRFYLRAKKDTFGNYTNISPVNGQLYYFSNLAANERNGQRYLSKPVADHANGTAYEPGVLAAHPVTHAVYEAITKHTSANVGELTGGTHWAALDAQAYITPQDQLPYTSGNYALTLPAPVNRAEVTIYGFDYNTVTPGYTVAIGEKDIQYFNTGEERSVIPVKLAGLKPGRYKVTVNATSREVYYDPAISGQPIMGVVEIFNHLPATNAYAFLDANELIVPQTYRLHFPTRRVLWKYTRKDGKAQTLSDAGVTAYGFTLHTDDFVSQKPIPFSETALATLELTFNTADLKLAPLPNPPAERLGRFNQGGYDYLCSAMYLNY